MKGATATKARGQIAAGGKASDRARPATAHTSSRGTSPGRAAFTRSRGRASSSCPPVGCGASRGSSCVQVNSVDWIGTTRDSPASSASLVRAVAGVGTASSSSSSAVAAASCVSCFSSRSWMDSTSPKPGSGVTPPSAMSSAVGSRSSIGSSSSASSSSASTIRVDVVRAHGSPPRGPSSPVRARILHRSARVRQRIRDCGRGKDPRDLWGRDAGAPRSLLSLLGPSVRHRRGGDAARTVAPPRGEGQGRSREKE